MKFGLRDGPWKTLFEGSFQGHEMEILMNPEQAMLLAIYDKEGEETAGVLLQVFSVFSAVGETETFIESLQREAVALSRHDGKHTAQFLAVASKPAYSKAEEEKIASSVDTLLAEAKEAGEKTETIAKSFDLQLTPIAKSSSAVRQAFFSQPFAIPMLAREAKRIEMEQEETMIQTGTKGAAVILGTNKAGKQVREPLELFQRTIVSDGTMEQRADFVRIIVESYLLGNTPAVVFDEEGYFSGLKYPTKKISELQAYGIKTEPMGFPVKEFEAGKSVKVNMNAISPAGFLELFGCGDEEAEKMLSQALKKGRVETPEQLIDRIESLEASDAQNPFVKKRLQRIVKLAETIYPELFGGPNNMEEIVQSWFKKIGKASIISVDKTDPRSLTFILDSLTEEAVSFFSRQDETQNAKLLIAIPRIEKVFAIKDSLILKDLIKMLTEMKRFGISFIIGADKRNDISKEIIQIAETKVSIIKENDAAIDFPETKNYRVLLRPSLSQGKGE
ncbi:MAG: hypothetical protein WC634_05630 [archaeon]